MFSSGRYKSNRGLPNHSATPIVWAHSSCKNSLIYDMHCYHMVVAKYFFTLTLFFSLYFLQQPRFYDCFAFKNLLIQSSNQFLLEKESQVLLILLFNLFTGFQSPDSSKCGFLDPCGERNWSEVVRCVFRRKTRGIHPGLSCFY